jgi:uncharacterized protein DUF4232
MYSPAFVLRRIAVIVAVACAAVLSALAVLAVESAPNAGASGATASATPPCKTSGLDIWFNNEGGGGTAGSVFYKLEFTNLSHHACTLRGYPTTWAMNLGGHRLGSNASHEGGAPHTVKLAVAASVPAQLRIVDAGNFSPSDCHPVTAAGLRVRPPGQLASRVVPFPFEACAKVGHSNLGVGPVVAE